MKKHVNNFFFNKKAAIFLDRDGIINKDYGYVYEVKNFDFVEDIFELLRYLKNKYLLFIVTNQSGIGRGLYSEKDFLKLNDFMIKKFNHENILIQEVLHCPHRPDDNCDCRKPNPKFINMMVKKYNIDKNKSWVIGDKKSDIQFAINAKITNSIYVNSDYCSLSKYSVKNINEIKSIIKF